NHCALFLIPGWGPIMGLPIEWRLEALKSPGVRAKLNELAKSKDAGVFRRLSGWGSYIIGDTYSEDNAGLEWREVAEIAEERGADPFDTLLDIVIADGLRTVLWPKPTDGDDETWAMRAEAWSDPRAMIGGSDAGAHLDRMCGANYPTAFLADCLRGRKLVELETTISMLTKQPADLFGLHDRGVLAPGNVADLFIFDPETVDSQPARLVNDLPGESPRLVAESIGVRRVIVNGTDILVDGSPTGALPGTILRSGIDTISVTTN
ncbi:MAG: amidohydrolase family protein, partial [Actinomycetota bacterium]